MRRSLFVIPSAILLLLAALATAGWFSLRHNITAAAADEIKAGMSRTDVESLLGGPPGKYFRWRRVVAIHPWSTTGMGLTPHESCWIADDCAVVVFFNTRTGRVSDSRFYEKILHSNERGFFVGGVNLVPEFVRKPLGLEG